MQELNQINLKEAVGKVIKGVYTQYNALLIVYMDLSFSYWEEYQDYDITVNEDITIKYKHFIKDIGIRTNGTYYYSNVCDLFLKSKLIDEDILLSDAKSSIEAKLSKQKARDLKSLKELQEKYKE